jgi:vesicle transport through interaction with t-SNAREs protein 1
LAIAEARKAALRRVELILDEADEMVCPFFHSLWPIPFPHRALPFQISQMQLEIQGIPKSLKSKYTPRLKSAQTELGRWKKLSREAHGKMQRGELFARSGGGFGGATSDEPYGAADDRTRLLVGHEVLEDGTR